jgi:O-acetyl-ADP-ribose deacetylase (regulator of RNase III)
MKKKSFLVKMLELFVEQCLSQADQRGVGSVSFPALGCGTLNMPPIQVAQSMIKVFKQFENKSPNSSVKEINIVIYPADEKIFKVH